MLDARSAFTLTPLPGDRALAAGGSRLADTEMYVPSGGSTSTGGPGPGVIAGRAGPGGLPGGWPVAAVVLLLVAVGLQQAYRRLRRR